jgi:hypothetical protein
MKGFGTLLLTLALAPAIAPRQFPPIGVIDFYGLRRTTLAQARQALAITEGDEPTPERLDAARARLEAISGVASAHLAPTCCEQGKSILYVGLQEEGAPGFAYRAAPRGAAALPPAVLRAARDLEAAVEEAVLAGDAGEDDSRGHALFNNPKARAIQETFPAFAARNAPLLREVLHTSADAGQRAVAAEVLAYAPDKRAVVGDLEEALRDPDEGVRNNATRALAVIAGFAAREPARKIRVSAEPFVGMLNSVVWTDRNKAGRALLVLTAGRDPKILARLREEALPSLVEMARWKSPGHAQVAFIVLGRVAGIPEPEIFAAWERGEREKVIAAVRAPGVGSYSNPQKESGGGAEEVAERYGSYEAE